MNDVDCSGHNMELNRDNYIDDSITDTPVYILEKRSLYTIYSVDYAAILIPKYASK